MEAEFQTITPKQAKDWLADQPKNRSVKQRRVEAIARDIKHGEWQLNGAAIVFDKDGKLADGQHRLAAVVLANKSIKTLVVHGVARDRAYPTIDSGAARTVGDVLSLHGESYAIRKAAIARVCLLVERDSLRKRNHVPTSQEILAWVSDHHVILAAHMSRIDRMNKNVRLPESCAGAVMVFGHEATDEGTVAEFFERVIIGANLDPDEPAFLLRRWAANREKSVSQFLAYSMIAKAWNMHIGGERRDILRFNPVMEKMPIVQGFQSS